MEAEFFYFMPRGQLTKEQIKCDVLKIKKELNDEYFDCFSDSRMIADRYLNKVLDKIEEYRV
ncbi:MAG: hypothetical protein RL131_1295 [Bacteroidota bacterium]|jgi:hypothetical protein